MPTTCAGDQTTAEATGEHATNLPVAHPATAGRTLRRRRERRAAASASQRPDTTVRECPDITPEAAVDATVQALVAAAPPLDPDRAARLALLLRLDQHHDEHG